MSPLTCVGCNVTYMCCSRPYKEKVSFHWALNGVSINNYSDKMELVGLRNRCDSCSGQSQCLTLRPLTDSANSKFEKKKAYLKLIIHQNLDENFVI